MGQDKIIQCINLLNNVETHGKQNMMNLLATLQILEQGLQEAQSNNGMDSSCSPFDSNRPVFHGGQADTQS